MNKLKSISLSLLAAASLVSCNDILFDNIDHNQASGFAAHDGLPTIIFYAQQINYDQADYGAYLSQCLTTAGKSQTGSYSYRSGWRFLNDNRHPQWRRHFYDLGVNANSIIESSKEIGSPNYELIARTIMLMSTQLTTDQFGDMPRTEAYKSNSPHYDTQESLYAWMLQEADDLIAMYNDNSIVNNPNNEVITVAQDRIFAGDLTKWARLVYAVKARILLRNIPNVNTSAAMCNDIIATAGKALEGWDETTEPRYHFQESSALESNCPWGEKQPIINSWESRANSLTAAIPSRWWMIDVLGTYNENGKITGGWGYGTDPRIQLLMEPRNGGTQQASGRYTGGTYVMCQNNIGLDQSLNVTSKLTYLFFNAYCHNDGYVPLFTKEELLFIQAEAYYFLGNRAEALRCTKEATEYNILRHEERSIADFGGYPQSNTVWEKIKSRFFNNDVDPSDSKNGKHALANVGNKRYFFDATKFSLSDLMTQKYIAMYLQPEQWNDMRRYHYSNNRNNIGIKTPFSASGEIVYQNLRRPFNLYAPYWTDGLSDEEKEVTWLQRINYDPESEDMYNPNELIRLGAYQNYKWLQKPMIWAEAQGVRTSLTAE